MTWDPQSNDLTTVGTLKTFIGTPAGRILGGTITAAGTYTAAPEITATGTGKNFSGLGILDGAGALIDMKILNQGEGYSAGSTTLVVDSTHGSGAALTPSVEDNNPDADAVLQRLVSAVSAFILRFSGVGFSAEATELYNGSDLRGGGRAELVSLFPVHRLSFGKILLGRWPISAVSELKVLEGTDWTTIPVSDGNGSDGFAFDSQFLYLIGTQYRIPAGNQNVSVKYTAGFVKGSSSELQELEDAALIIAGARWNKRQSFGIASKNLAGEHGVVVSFSRDDIPAEALSIIERFRVPVAA